jgi:hypothetical protein
VALLPRPDRTLTDLLDDEAQHLAPARAALLHQRGQAALDAAAANDFDAVRRAMQAVRHAVLTSGTDDVGPDVAGEIDAVVEPYLGSAAGLFGILVLIRDAEHASAVDGPTAAALREPAATAVAHARSGDDAAMAEALADLAEQVEAADGDGPTLARLLAAVEAQHAEHTSEAETATLLGGARTNAEHPGYTGTGFVRDLAKAGAGVRFTYEAAAPTTVEVSFRYANGMVVAPLDRQLSVAVDGGKAQPVSFPNLGQGADRWRIWDYSPGVRFTLAAGRHEILLHHTATDTGNINLDHLRVTAQPGVLTEPATDAWGARTVYTAGDLVSHDGSLWQASWWTQNQTPGASAYGSWQEIAEAYDGTAVWTPSRIFDTGDFVEHDGELYEARWWTRNQAPGDRHGPWRAIG